jgi:hypothetical protein
MTSILRSSRLQLRALGGRTVLLALVPLAQWAPIHPGRRP